VDSARQWSAGIARQSLMGKERTHNPSPAAYSVFGQRRVARARRVLKSRGRRPAHRDNPAPAVIASVLGPLLGKRFQSRDKRDAARKAAADSLAQRALLGDAGAIGELEVASQTFATQAAKTYALTRLAQVRAQIATTAAEAKAASAAARRAETTAAGAGRVAREARFLEAGTSVAGALAQAALLRGRGRSPARRRSYRTPRSRRRTSF